MTHPQPCRKGTNLSGINVWFAELTSEKKQPSLLLRPSSRRPSASDFKSSEGLGCVQPSTGRESKWRRNSKLSLLLFFVFKKIIEFPVSVCHSCVFTRYLYVSLFILSLVYKYSFELLSQACIAIHSHLCYLWPELLYVHQNLVSLHLRIELGKTSQTSS